MYQLERDVLFQQAMWSDTTFREKLIHLIDLIDLMHDRYRDSGIYVDFDMRNIDHIKLTEKEPGITLVSATVPAVFIFDSLFSYLVFRLKNFFTKRYIF